MSSPDSSSGSLGPGGSSALELIPGLLRQVPPGSRLLLWQPPDWEAPLELARRGYRLMPLSSSQELLGELKQQLRACGLASQMLGSAHLPSRDPETPTPPSLASRFYEAAVVWGLAADSQAFVAALSPALESQAVLLLERNPGRPPSPTPALFRTVRL